MDRFLPLSTISSSHGGEGERVVQTPSPPLGDFSIPRPSPLVEEDGRQPSSNGLILLGAPRSGLSLLVDALHLLGMNAGEQREVAFKAGPTLIHALLCQDLGVSPLMAGGLPEGWLDSTAAREARRRIRELLIALEQTGAPWVLADTFLSRVWPLWRAVLEELGSRPGVVQVVRHPWETARSLAAVAPVEAATGYLIWLVCQRAALAARGNYPYVLVTLDQLLADPVSLLASIRAALGLASLSDPYARVQALLALVHPETQRFHAGSAPAAERAAFGACWRIYEELRAGQIGAPTASEPIQPTWELLECLVEAVGQHERRATSPAASLPTRSVAELSMIWQVPRTSGGFMEQPVRLLEEAWQKVNVPIPEPEALADQPLQVIPLNQKGTVWLASVRVVNPVTGTVVWAAQGAEGFAPIQVQGAALRLPHAENGVVLVTGDDPRLVLPGLKVGLSGPLEVVAWVKASRDQRVAHECLGTRGVAVNQSSSGTQNALASSSVLTEADLEGLCTGQTFLDQAMRTVLRKLQSQNVDLATQFKKNQDELIRARKFLESLFKKELFNATKQIEAFCGVQHYLQSGELIGDMHGWLISPDFALYLIELLESNDYDLVIEFGSGTSTVLIAKTLQRIAGRGEGQAPAKQVAFEHLEEYYQKTLVHLQQAQLEEKVDLVLAPLQPYTAFNGQTYLYYTCQETLAGLANLFRLAELRIFLLVDGPPAATGQHARYPAAPLVLEYFAGARVDILLDDYIRNDEKEIAQQWLTDIQDKGLQYQLIEKKLEKDACLIRVSSVSNHQDQQIS